ncbi:hypothetical protein Dimus_004080 [Dionaea muscipula]
MLAKTTPHYEMPKVALLSCVAGKMVDGQTVPAQEQRMGTASQQQLVETAGKGFVGNKDRRIVAESVHRFMGLSPRCPE